MGKGFKSKNDILLTQGKFIFYISLPRKNKLWENKMTQKYLKSIIEYNQETGQFLSIVNRGKCKVGDNIGTIGKDGYLVARIKGKNYSLQKLAWLFVYGVYPKNEIDHKNQIKKDNRIDNLRDITHKENCKNYPLYKNNKSGIIGVYWASEKNMWRARISVDGKRKSLGLFKEKADAIKARKDAEIKYGFYENHGKN